MTAVTHNAVVYCFYESATNLPRYVGWGATPRRPQQHLNGRSHNPRLAALTASGVEDVDFYYELLAHGLTEDRAKELEVEWIARIGRLDAVAGTLWNATDGGDGKCGAIVSVATLKKLHAANEAKGNAAGIGAAAVAAWELGHDTSHGLLQHVRQTVPRAKMPRVSTYLVYINAAVGGDENGFAKLGSGVAALLRAAMRRIAASPRLAAKRARVSAGHHAAYTGIVSGKLRAGHARPDVRAKYTAGKIARGHAAGLKDACVDLFLANPSITTAEALPIVKRTITKATRHAVSSQLCYLRDAANGGSKYARYLSPTTMARLQEARSQQQFKKAA